MMRPVFDPKEVTVSNRIPMEQKPAIKAYPNPSRGILKFTDSWDEIKVYDLQGRLQYQTESHAGQNVIDISTLKNNLYI
jgi:hypothetical protein